MRFPETPAAPRRWPTPSRTQTPGNSMTSPRVQRAAAPRANGASPEPDGTDPRASALRTGSPDSKRIPQSTEEWPAVNAAGHSWQCHIWCHFRPIARTIVRTGRAWPALVSGSRAVTVKAIQAEGRQRCCWQRSSWVVAAPAAGARRRPPLRGRGRLRERPLRERPPS